LITIRLLDGQKQCPEGVTAGEALAGIKSGANELPIAAMVDGVAADLSRPLFKNCSLAPIFPHTAEGIEIIRHSASHVMAHAVMRLWPDTKLAIGPATSEGFYYDFDTEHRFTAEDLPAIEAEMRKIAKANVPFRRAEVLAEHAYTEALERGDTYKAELIDTIRQTYRVELGTPSDKPLISTYSNEEFTDLCRGPHVPTTGQIGAFKLLSVAGAYWRGDEKNAMLQRIYGTAFPTQAELDEYLRLVEEAKLRDHRRLGKDLDLFSMDELVGPGLVLWHPRAGRIRTIIENFWRDEHYKHGYELIYTPHIGRIDLWNTSGHTSFYRENMYSTMQVDEQEFQIKPMNCPFHIQIYKTHKHSYREFPLRWAELGTVYRYEKAGVMHGLLRVRGFTQDDAHIFCRIDQLEDEIQRVLDFVLYILRTFGFNEFKIALSTRPEKFVGEVANWDKATDALRHSLDRSNLPYVVQEGEGAFYGPKIDINVKDALGRAWQCSTIQVDFNLPERFDMTYTGQDGADHRPILIHRALMGSLERFFGCLIEHYAGAFPLWLAPVQAVVIPIAERHAARAGEVVEQLRAVGFRVELDARSEKVGFKIREATTQKTPYMLIVGDRELESGQVSVRKYKVGDAGSAAVDAVIREMAAAVESKQ